MVTTRNQGIYSAGFYSNKKLTQGSNPTLQCKDFNSKVCDSFEINVSRGKIQRKSDKNLHEKILQSSPTIGFRFLITPLMKIPACIDTRKIKIWALYFGKYSKFRKHIYIVKTK
ncbi:hypothetical protein BpHYR1_006799 [Brachionus plicatilis]|uniref:Uncharacterized protein n=1 Tax=Brachionus plicatilis TaxID=10195 RepID=A0A3M7SKZ5_BRAPC|nr:hypothetical protein BpHYR1_006799 [Brachionus plicatilis]